MSTISRWSLSALASTVLLAVNPPAAAADDAIRPLPQPWTYAEPAHLGWFGDRRPLDGSYRYLPTAQWSGFFVGGLLGAAAGSADTGGSALGDIGMSGFAGGLLGGYNIQLGSLVAGVEADVTWASLDGSENVAGLNATAGHDWLGSVRGRLGYATENWLLYGTLGYAFADFHLDTSDFGTHLSQSAHPNGFVYGAGAEYAISPQLSLRGEVLRYTFEDMSFDLPSGVLTADPDVTTVRAGLSLRFN